MITYYSHAHKKKNTIRFTLWDFPGQWRCISPGYAFELNPLNIMCKIHHVKNNMLNMSKRKCVKEKASTCKWWDLFSHVNSCGFFLYGEVILHILDFLTRCYNMLISAAMFISFLAAANEYRAVLRF